MAIENYMISCPSKLFLGIECFGCGGQRALLLLMKGKFLESFYMYPAIYPILLFCILFILKSIDKKREYSKAIQITAWISGITVVVSYYIKYFFF